MKKLWIVGLILVLLLPHLVLAQGDQQYDQDGLSFTYPEGWFTRVEEDDLGVNVSNAEFTEESDNLLQSQPGVIQITIAALLPGSLDGTPIPAETDPVFIAGYFAGFLGFAASFVGAFSDDAGPVYTFSSLERTTINDHDAAMLTLSDETTKMVVITMEINDTAVLVLGQLPAAEFDQWQDTIMGLAESVNYAP